MEVVMGKVQTLFFRTKEKTTTLMEDMNGKYTISEFSFDNVSTVAVRGNYYEIMVKKGEHTVPVGRLPISCTNMIILDE